MMKLQPWQDAKDLSLWGKSFGICASIMIGVISYNWNAAPWEILSAVSGVICVVLVAEGKLSNYLYGLVNCSLYGLTSYYNGFYGDMTLNWAFYLPFQFIGFYLWSRSVKQGESLLVNSLSKNQWTFAIAGLIASTSVVTQVLIKLGGNHPLTDASNVCLSLLATLLMALRFKEQWLCWIAVNISGILLWMNTGYGGKAALLMWVAFLINSLYGYYKWAKTEAEQ